MKIYELDKRLSLLGNKLDGQFFKILLPIGALIFLLLLAITVTVVYGLNTWGINIPVAWGFAIVNFVWWIGIGHAGTFISAILLISRQSWRNSINRLAETMTLFAVASAGLYPLLHMGRPWYFYWLLPYPNDMDLYPQYRSPLTWDAFAVSTYAGVSLLFWYIGLLPDLAAARSQVDKKWKKYFYFILSLGFSGEIREWASFKKATTYLAILATPLVISVHTIVSLDFAVSINPGWHSPMFPPFFVAGAIYSGFAMVIILLMIVQRYFSLQDIITDEQIDKCAKMLLLSGMLVTFFYILEFFMAWYADEDVESAVFLSRMSGEKFWSFWLMIFCNTLPIQLLWFRDLRRKKFLLIIISLFVLVGMWMERYVIVITTLMKSFLPSMSGHYTATVWDWGLFIGSFGLFLFGLLVVVRFIPFISINEVKEEIVHESV